MNFLISIMDDLSKTIVSVFDKPQVKPIYVSLLEKEYILSTKYRVIKVQNSLDKGMHSNFDDSLNYLISTKKLQEVILETKKKSFFEKVSEILMGSPDFKNVKEISHYSDEELIDILKGWDLDAYSYVQISQYLKDIRDSKRQIRKLEGRIKSILRNIRKMLRNFKEVFKRQHSFHFKNLDDTHSLILVNKL